MNLTRRIFAALIPAAPVAGLAARSGLGSSNLPLTTPPIPMDVAGRTAPEEFIKRAAQKVIYPAKWQEYQEAIKVVANADHYRYLLKESKNDYSMDPNIEALKSVSKQHKAHMAIKQRQEQQKASRTFMERLAEEFGVAEFLKKRDQLKGNDGLTQANDW